MGRKRAASLGTPVTESWASVHKCPACGTEVSLAEMDLQEATTGIVPCSNPECGWSGQINLQIVARADPATANEVLPAKRRSRRQVKSHQVGVCAPCSSTS